MVLKLIRMLQFWICGPSQYSRSPWEVGNVFKLCQEMNLRVKRLRQCRHGGDFPMSTLTLHPLHGGQTSQGTGRCSPASDPINDIHETYGGVTGDVRNGRYAQSS